MELEYKLEHKLVVCTEPQDCVMLMCGKVDIEQYNGKYNIERLSRTRGNLTILSNFYVLRQIGTPTYSTKAIVVNLKTFCSKVFSTENKELDTIAIITGSNVADLQASVETVTLDKYNEGHSGTSEYIVIDNTIYDANLKEAQHVPGWYPKVLDTYSNIVATLENGEIYMFRFRQQMEDVAYVYKCSPEPCLVHGGEFWSEEHRRHGISNYERHELIYPELWAFSLKTFKFYTSKELYYEYLDVTKNTTYLSDGIEDYYTYKDDALDGQASAYWNID